MKKLLITIASLGVILSNCKSTDNGINCMSSPTSLPACVQAKIDLIKKVPVWNPPASIYSYVYGDRTVYSFSADCCDQFNVVYDANCKVICSPSGGITGSGNGRCPDFQKKATNETLIWKDNRKK